MLLVNDLGTVDSNQVSTLYTILHAQQNAIYFNGADGDAPVASLWTSYWASELDLVQSLLLKVVVDANNLKVNFFYNDYNNMVSVSAATDNQIESDSIAAGGQDYSTITTLSARQAFAAVQLCGTSNKTYLFLKEISSDGNIQTVDVLFPAMPIFLYTNPILVKYVLDPLFENQEAGRFPQTYAMHDLGANYPRAIGHPTGDGGSFKSPHENSLVY